MSGDIEAIGKFARDQEPIDPTMRIDQPMTLTGADDDPATGYDMSLTGTAQSYYVGPPPLDEDWYLTRLLVMAVDGDFNNAGNYGAIVGGLPTGILLEVVDIDDNLIYNFTKVPIQFSYDWVLYAGNDNVLAGGAGEDAMKVRWTFSKAGYPVVLRGARHQRLRFIKSDDLSSMERHIATVQGFKRKTSVPA